MTKKNKMGHLLDLPGDPHRVHDAHLSLRDKRTTETPFGEVAKEAEDKARTS